MVYIFSLFFNYMQRKKKRRRKRGMFDELLRYTRPKKKYKKLNKGLTRLNKMVGMNQLKQAVVEQIQFLISNNGDTEGHFLNTCIFGPPGTGKTTVAHILYEIWTSLNIFDNDDLPEFKVLTRSDFVGSYMGHTANKTRKLLQKHSGNVLFIDEAYSLVSGEKDDYGKEAIDEINAFMSEEKGKTIIIIAGYEQRLNNSFFGQNCGLRRRFNWFFSAPKYTHSELAQIFTKQLQETKWKLGFDPEKLFKEYYDRFENAGGDCDNIGFKCKLHFSTRMWNRKKRPKVLTEDDVKQGFHNHFSLIKRDNTVANMYI